MGGFISAPTNLASPSAIGSTTPNTGAFTTLSANNGAITTSSPAITLAQTWNAAGTTFTSLRVNVTDTASASGSLLMDLQVGGSSRFGFSKSGLMFISDSYCGSSQYADVRIGGGTGGVFLYVANGGNLRVRGNGYLGFSSNTGDATGSADVMLYRDASAILAQRNSTNAQTFRIYNTFTDASNYERGFMRWATNVLEIGAEAAGTGTQRTLSFLGGSNNSAISFTANSLCAVFGNNANVFYKIIQLEAGLRYSGNDAGLFRNAAGVVEVNNGTAGTFRDLIVRNLRMSAPTLVPASASATGSEGQISWDASYIYVCTATNTWKRVAIATW